MYNKRYKKYKFNEKKNIIVKFSGEEYNSKYIETNINENKYIYDDIYKHLKSINNNISEINKIKSKYPKMHINQILSKFNIYYPKYLNGKDIRIIKKEEVSENLLRNL